MYELFKLFSGKSTINLPSTEFTHSGKGQGTGVIMSVCH